MSIKEFVSKANVQVALAVFVVVFCLYCLAFVKLEQSITIVFAGYIGSVLGFYFGSSRGSQLKDINNKN